MNAMVGRGTVEWVIALLRILAESDRNITEAATELSVAAS